MKRPAGFYRRVPVRALVDQRLRRLGWPEWAVYSYLLGGPHSQYLATIYRLPVPYMISDLGKPEEEVRAALRNLIAAGLIEHDTDAELVLVTGLQDDLVDGGQTQLRALCRHLASLPPSPLVERWRQEHGDLIAAEDTPSDNPEYPIDTPSIPHPGGISISPTPNNSSAPAKPAARGAGNGLRGVLPGDPF